VIWRQNKNLPPFFMGLQYNIHLNQPEGT